MKPGGRLHFECQVQHRIGVPGKQTVFLGQVNEFPGLRPLGPKVRTARIAREALRQSVALQASRPAGRLPALESFAPFVGRLRPPTTDKPPVSATVRI